MIDIGFLQSFSQSIHNHRVNHPMARFELAWLHFSTKQLASDLAGWLPYHTLRPKHAQMPVIEPKACFRCTKPRLPLLLAGTSKAKLAFIPGIHPPPTFNPTL